MDEGQIRIPPSRRKYSQYFEYVPISDMRPLTRNDISIKYSHFRVNGDGKAPTVKTDKPTFSSHRDGDKDSHSRPRDSRPRDSRPRDSRPRDSRPRDSRPRDTNYSSRQHQRSRSRSRTRYRDVTQHLDSNYDRPPSV